MSIEPIRCEGDSYVEALRQLYDTCWKRSRGAADWVVVCNVDEHLHHPSGLASHLDACQRAGVTVIPSRGYEMVSLRFPPADVQLSHAVTRGLRCRLLDKTAIFSPDAITATEFGRGRHSARPAGHVSVAEGNETRLLHYKYLGFRYLRSRYAELDARRRPQDRALGFGRQYGRSDLQLLLRFVRLLVLSRRIVAGGGDP